MNTPTSWASREDSMLLLNAYLDNELDAAAVLDVERKLAADAALRAEYDRLVVLRRVMSTQLRSDRASDGLRARVSAIANNKASTQSVLRRLASDKYWQKMAAAAALAAIVSSSATYLSLTGVSGSNDLAAIIAGHQRALLAASPFDVASSDRHTVKPWFDAKLAVSPQIVDLATEGFPLAGGRVDLIDGKAVPAMVYKRREHVISVVAIPAPSNRDRGSAPVRSTRDGFTVLRWDGNDFRYAAISDVAEAELNYFVATWRKKSP